MEELIKFDNPIQNQPAKMDSASLYLKKGKVFKVTSKEELDIHERLPTATYTVGFTSCSGEFYLEKIDPFSVPDKLYGNPDRLANRILRTFHNRKGSTGVVLAGEKGSGKTLLAKYISKLGAERDGIVTLVINEAWCGEAFNQFLQMIQQPAIVIFDEFEKVYHETTNRTQLLTLLDGVYPSQKLFLLTCNDKWNLDVHMTNRPGRIFYMIDYTGLDDAFIRDYCQDKLLAKEHIPKIINISKVFQAFNFDMLQAMVEEMNRYGETPMEVLEFLNVSPQYESETRYTYRVFDKHDRALKTDENEYYQNPLKDHMQLWYYAAKDKHRYNAKKAEFSANDLVRVDEATGAFVFVNARGIRAVLKRQKNSASTLKSLSDRMQRKQAEGLLSNGISRMLLDNAHEASDGDESTQASTSTGVDAEEVEEDDNVEDDALNASTLATTTTS